MLRSFIDDAIADALDVCARYGAALPGFATWSPEEALLHPGALERMIAGGLGWNVVEFGSGRFATDGLVVFTSAWVRRRISRPAAGGSMPRNG